MSLFQVLRDCLPVHVILTVHEKSSRSLKNNTKTELVLSIISARLYIYFKKSKITL